MGKEETLLKLKETEAQIRAAKDAGMWCVAVPNPVTRSLDLSAADAVLDSLAGVTLGHLRARTTG